MNDTAITEIEAGMEILDWNCSTPEAARKCGERFAMDYTRRGFASTYVGYTVETITGMIKVGGDGNESLQDWRYENLTRTSYKPVIRTT
jgi:hypothetical protein